MEPGRDAREDVVTENGPDFIALHARLPPDAARSTAVIIAMKRNLPSGAAAMVRALADKLDAWANDNPQLQPTIY